MSKKIKIIHFTDILTFNIAKEYTIFAMMSRIDQIINQSATLFYRKGFQATSMREIAAQIDIKAASLYNHINAKEDLLAAIIMRLANEFVDHINKQQMIIHLRLIN